MELFVSISTHICRRLCLTTIITRISESPNQGYSQPFYRMETDKVTMPSFKNNNYCRKVNKNNNKLYVQFFHVTTN